VRCNQAFQRRFGWRFPARQFRRRYTAVDRAQHFGDAKISNFHPADFVEQQVLRFDVPVDNAPVVGELQRVAQRWHDCQRLLGGNLPRAQKLA
jgi:hypothetical protein